MIQPHCHTRDWIESQRETLRAADPAILERAIFALTLLSALSRTSLDFVFKGGTALLLHLPRPRRLSIDIDIICKVEKGDLESVLGLLLPETPFLRWEEQVRGESRLPKRLHYKFFFTSPLRPATESHILLDVVTEENVLSDLVEKPILTSFVEVAESTLVKTPSINALLGDKLTAFAPNTIGVPLTDRYSQQVIKQLFDIGQLYSMASDPGSIASANAATHGAELSYRRAGPSYRDYLSDIIETCLQLCALDLRGTVETGQTQLLRRGIVQLANHLIDCRFKLPDAKVAAAKTAFLASMLKDGVHPATLPVYNRSRLESFRTLELSSQFVKLRKLQSINPEAYFYWLACK